MSFLEILILLFLVIDPFGNLPLVITLLRDLDDRTFQKTLLRETAIALVILVVFLFAGGQVLRFLSISQPSLKVAGGVILFLISIKMIFRGSAEIFEGSKDSGPVIVPIAVPSIAGPATITTLMILRTHAGVSITHVLVSLGLVVSLQLMLFLIGRKLTRLLGRDGIKALEKLTGLLLNLIAVNMILSGLGEHF